MAAIDMVFDALGVGFVLLLLAQGVCACRRSPEQRRAVERALRSERRRLAEADMSRRYGAWF